MVLGLAYRGSCLPLAFWAYRPTAWPMGQVALIRTLLGWIAPALPAGVIPLVQADRGFGTLPDLIRVADNELGRHYLFRVKKQTRFRHDQGASQALSELLSAPGQTWHGSGQVFKKAGWLTADVHILWGQRHQEAWRPLTNCPAIEGWDYARRYWQEASFRDLKSDGWQWQTSRIATPLAHLLLLVMALVFGTLTFDDPALHMEVTHHPARSSFFRLGSRLCERFHGHLHQLLMAYPVIFSPWLMGLPFPSKLSVCEKLNASVHR